MFDDDIPLMARLIGDVNVYGVSGMPDNHLVAGRRFGGCAVVVTTRLKCLIEPIASVNRRLFSFVITLECKSKLIVHNVYMPCDTEYDDNNLSEFMNVLYEIDFVNAVRSDIDNVVIGGDFNTDLSRPHSLHSPALVEFCRSRSLALCCETDKSTVDFSYVSDVSQRTSLIDHFVVSRNLLPHVESVIAVHDGHNLSDHHPVFVKLRYKGILLEQKDRVFVEKPRWNQSNEAHLAAYRDELSRLLQDIEPPLDALACHNHNCTRHYDDIEQYYCSIVKCCSMAAKSTIPSSKSRRKAGWNDKVGPYQEQAKLWYRIWHDNGRPEQGILKDIMVKTKKEYKRVSKWVLRNQDRIKSDRMADALLSNKNRVFWDEVKRKNQKVSSVPSTVESLQGNESICRMFADKYETLYSSVPFDQGEMDELLHDLDELVESKCMNNNGCYFEHSVNVTHVIRAVKQLKRGKSEADNDICSDHIINGSQELFVCLSFLFNVMISHQTAPRAMLTSALIPIPKDKKKSLSNSDNYRSIALSSIIAKVLDKIILKMHADILNTSPLQFGFKEKHSTAQCTFVLEEVVSHYVDSDSTLYCILLDASKAFDRLHFIKLFRLLMKRDFCPVMCKLLLWMYKEQRLVVNWNGAKSPSMSCKNGVKQGGVLSPVLFCIYMDELLGRLVDSRIGCFIGSVYMGALAYADDLTLLAPSHQAAHRMLAICEEFAAEYRVLYNPTKSIMLTYNCDQNVNVCLNGAPIKVVKSCKHLGVEIGMNASAKNIERSALDIVRRTNLLLAKFASSAWFVKRNLFRSFCCHFYGCPLWKLNLKSIDRLNIAWKKCCRKILELSPLTRSKYVHPLMSTPSLLAQLYNRFVSFWYSCLMSDNHVIKFICERVTYHDTNVAHNVRSILHLAKCRFSLERTKAHMKRTVFNALKNEYTQEELCVIQAIEELRNCKYNVDQNFVFEIEEIDSFIYYLAVYT